MNTVRRMRILLPLLWGLSAGLLQDLPAQTPPSPSLRGTVKDQSGAVVPGVEVLLKGPGGELQSFTDANGKYEFPTLAPGTYSMRATIQGFAANENPNLEITGPVTLDVQLKIETISQEVDVKEEADKVSVEPEANSGALVLGDKELESLSDDPDELSQQLQAMAGPGAGPSGGQVFIDGFSGGQLPPKSSIREVRINSNPFSPEYDRPGFGRIEILTKPGTDLFHGQAFFQFNNQSLNARSPLLAQSTVPPYKQEFYDVNINGPIKKQKASFGINFERRNINEDAFVLATTLDSNLNPVTVNQAVTTPQTRTNVTPRLDYSINANNTLVVRYQYMRLGQDGQGIGSFSLPSTAYNQATTENTLQVTETAVLSVRMVNETRLQYRRNSFLDSGAASNPALSVQGAFTDGGAAIGDSGNTTNSWEVSNMSTYTRGKHVFKWGARAREYLDSDISLSNFNGTFSFFGGQGPILDANNQAIPGSSEQLTALQVYQRTLLLQKAGFSPSQIRALGGGASLFSIGAGTPSTSVNQFDIGLFGNDDWKVRPNLTLSYGFRYETQTNIGDYSDWSPRLGIAWGIDGKGNKAAKTILRAGFGTFYDRFPYSTTLQSIRYNGVTQQSYLIVNPDFFPTMPSLTSLQAGVQPQQLQLIDPHLVAPRVYQANIGIERQINKYARISINYITSRGVHLLRTRDINALLDGVHPFGDDQVRFLTESTGFSRTNQLFVNPTVNYKNLSMFGFYAFSHGHDDNEGQPANPYDLRAEWGPSSYGDIRHRGVLGFSLPVPWRVSISPFIVMSSGAPYTITTGRDLFGDGVTSARPGLLSNVGASGCSGSGLIYEPDYGCFDLNPGTSAPILGRNSERGPAVVNLNLRISRTWSFGVKEGSGDGGNMMQGGPRGGFHGMGGGPHGGPMGMWGSTGTGKYNLTLMLVATNALNHPNFAPPSGDLSSPYFGISRSLAANFGPMGSGSSAFDRRVGVQLRFTF